MSEPATAAPTRWSFRPWVVAVAVTALVAGSVAATVLLTTHEKIESPPGCTKAERAKPGCHPRVVKTGVNAVALATVLITPLVTLAVALVAANSASSRLRTQLDEEKARLKTQLDAEAEREQQRLDHERLLHDRDGLRDLVKDTTAVMLRLGRAASEVTSAVSREDRGVADDPEIERSAAVTAFFTLVSETVEADAALLVHFSEDSEVYKAYQAHRAGAISQVEALSGKGPPDERLRAASALVRQTGEQAKKFREAARPFVRFASEQE